MFDLTDFIFSPSASAKEVLENESNRLWPLFLVLVFLIPLAHSFTAALASRQAIASFGISLLAGYWAKVLLFGLANLLTSGMVFFIASLITTEKGPSPAAFMVLFLASWFPMAFMPAWMLVLGQAGMAGQVLSGLAWLATFAWVFLLQVAVIRAAFGASRIKSALIYAATAAAVFIFDGLLFYVAVLTVASAV